MSTLHDFVGWSFIPGPLKNPPPDSQSLYDIVEYPPAVVADTFLSVPGMTFLQGADPSWWEWKARWETADRFIELDMSLFESEPPAWGGSAIASRCTADDLLSLWRAMRARCPAVWLHNSACEIVTPEEFSRRFA